MAQSILVRPFNNISNPDEESVLAILAHLMPVIDDWRAGEDFRVELEQVNASTVGLNQDVEQVKADLTKVQSKLGGIFTNFSSPPVLLLLGGGLAVVGGGIIALVMSSAAAKLLIFLGFLSAGAGTVKFLGKKKQLNNEISLLETKLAEKTSQLASAKERVDFLRKELISRADTFPEITQTRVAFPISGKTILGKNTLLDESGLFESASLETIDLSAIQSDMEAITSKIEAIKSVPVLLSPVTANDDADAINVLYGEENVLQTLVGEFTNAVGQIRDVELRLPLIPNANFLAQIYQKNQCLENQYKKTEIVEIESTVLSDGNLDQFVAQVNATKEFGTKVLVQLKGTFESLQNICESYSLARSTSINAVHSKLFEVLNKASWCSKRFYCPRTIQSQKYLQDVLNIYPEEAHKLDFEVLMKNLTADPIIENRIRVKPEYSDLLYATHQSIYDLKGNIDFDENGNPIDLGERPAFIQDQYQEALVRFRRALNVVMTGSANPVLNFSKEAEMFYEPDVDEWRSDVVPYVYDTPSIMRYGQVLKVTTDLLVPLWEHLWTEKADFRKSELFRTNESLIRMSEKESEKLIEVGNQFKADMRTVRENIYLLESDLTSKCDEVIGFRDGMNALGLLSDRQKMFLTDEKLKALSLGDQSVLSDGEGFETLLGMEPKAQAERRGGVNDPIDFVRAPDLLVSYHGGKVQRLASF